MLSMSLTFANHYLISPEGALKNEDGQMYMFYVKMRLSSSFQNGPTEQIPKEVSVSLP